MDKIREQIVELNQNYNDLGEDLVLLESVILAVQDENDFPQEYIVSSPKRMQECIKQHTGDIRFFAELLRKEVSPAPGEPKAIR